jgi:glucosamine--fructose-6-phosphate aminotransferase (isomerizing)
VCGIGASVRRWATRAVPTSEEIRLALPVLTGTLAPDSARLNALAESVEAVDLALSGVPGVTCLVGDPDLAATVAHRIDELDASVADLEASLEDSHNAETLEAVNAAVVRLKDTVWKISRDRLRTARAVEELCGDVVTEASFEAFTSVQEALSAIDRLEVRGRDSAGLHLLVRGHGLDLTGSALAAEIAARSQDQNFGSGSVRAADRNLSFIYKAAAEIGELGDNTRKIRQEILDDDLLHRALDNTTASVAVLGHPRGASVGIISEPNAHPLNSEQTDNDSWPYVTAALNGDVDNFADIRSAEGLQIAPAISTDAKVIPTLMSSHLAGLDGRAELSGIDESFRRTVAELEGSVAIAVSAAVTPNRLQLALRGSGQALYVGLAEDAFVVARSSRSMGGQRGNSTVSGVSPTTGVS